MHSNHKSDTQCKEIHESITEESSIEEEKPQVWNLLNFTVQEEGKSKCYSCDKEFLINGFSVGSELLIHADQEFFKKFYNYDGSNTKEKLDLFRPSTYCPCGAKVIFLASLPLAKVNQIEDTDLVHSILEKNEPKLRLKLIELYNNFKLYFAYNGQNLSNPQFPAYLFPSIIEVESGRALSLKCSKKTQIHSEHWFSKNEKVIRSVMEDLTNKIIAYPELSGSTYGQSLGVNFSSITKEKYDYKSYLCLDIDGTSSCHFLKSSLGAPTKLSFLFFKFLAHLEKRKILKTILASGRPIEWILMFMLDCGLVPLGIGSNGSSCIYYRNNYQLNKPAIHIQKAATKEILGQIVHLLKHKYPNLPIKQFVSLTGATAQILLYADGLDAEVLQQILKTDQQILEYIKQVGLGELNATYDGSNFINIQSVKYTKGKTLSKLFDRLKLDKNLIMSIGNHYNDVSLCGIVGTSYAVDNALPEFKSAVSKICINPQACGSIEAIKDFLISNNIIKLEEFNEIIRDLNLDLKKELNGLGFSV